MVDLRLRPRQQQAADRAVDALLQQRNALLVAPTGFGKTIVLSALVCSFLSRLHAAEKILVVQHRDEILQQNRQKLMAMNPDISCTVVDGTRKEFDGRIILASIDTLRRPEHLRRLPASLGLVVIDEAHHCRAASYMKLLAAVGALPDRAGLRRVPLLGLTATPERTDRRQLGKVFRICADRVSYAELVLQGQLVPPVTFQLDPGVRAALRAVRYRGTDFDDAAVGKILNVDRVNEAVVAGWREHARGRKTIVFCSTVEHAHSVAATFRKQAVAAETVHGETPRGEREDILHRLRSGDLQVVTNVAVLTEGFDAPVVSCIVLLRLTSSRGPMVQMIGRGLRTIDAQEYPDITKTDCLVLDWGTSTEVHGSLENSVELLAADPPPGTAPFKRCPECEFDNPIAAVECVDCGYEFPPPPAPRISLADALKLRESDVTRLSPFRWEAFFDGTYIVASAFDAHSVILQRGALWHALGIDKDGTVTVLQSSRKAITLAAADYFLQTRGSRAAFKDRLWLNEPMTERQTSLLERTKLKRECLNADKYRASCAITLHAHRSTLIKAIQSLRTET
jgi:superfamily II DNA or RNA helicase